jgi:hypothetical protein
VWLFPFLKSSIGDFNNWTISEISYCSESKIFPFTVSVAIQLHLYAASRNLEFSKLFYHQSSLIINAVIPLILPCIILSFFAIAHKITTKHKWATETEGPVLSFWLTCFTCLILNLHTMGDSLREGINFIRSLPEFVWGS